MTHRRRLLVVSSLMLVAGCRLVAVDAMSRTTLLVDQQFASAYATAADECLESSEDWAEYDTCMLPWTKSAEAVRQLRDVTKTLDVSKSRPAFKRAACLWFVFLNRVDGESPVSLPAVEVGLSSRWSRRC